MSLATQSPTSPNSHLLGLFLTLHSVNLPGFNLLWVLWPSKVVTFKRTTFTMCASQFKAQRLNNWEWPALSIRLLVTQIYFHSQWIRQQVKPSRHLLISQLLILNLLSSNTSMSSASSSMRSFQTGKQATHHTSHLRLNRRPLWRPSASSRRKLAWATSWRCIQKWPGKMESATSTLGTWQSHCPRRMRHWSGIRSTRLDSTTLTRCSLRYLRWLL